MTRLPAALAACATVIASAAVARSHPNSPTTGLRKTPKVKNITGPLLTVRPRVAPSTSHQRLTVPSRPVIAAGNEL